MSAIGAILEASWALLQPSGRCLGRSGQRSADMLNFMVFSMFFFDLSGPRGGLEGILELLEATEELSYALRGILDALIALLETSWPLLDAS